MSARKPLGLALALLVALLLAPAAARADFGIKTMSVGTFNKDGSVDLKAGSHPYEFRVGVQMNQDAEETPEETLREIVVDLPAGMVGNPQALPLCTGAQFEGQIARCPADTQIGVAHVNVTGLEQTVIVPVYNLTPPLGVPASVGFSIVNENSFQEASLRPSDYGVNISDVTLPTANAVRSFEETIWGIPTDPSHDPLRVCFLPGGGSIEGCPSTANPAPFLSLPTSCGGPLQTTATVSSVQEPEVSVSKSVQSLDEGGSPHGLEGCDRPPFEPQIQVQPETSAADSPTGLHVGLDVPQNEDPEGIATAHLKDAFVALPQGFAVNPSSADGLAACSLAQIGLGTEGPGSCPAASEVGTVKAQTPLLDHPVPGTVYLARQSENPFGSLIALYVVLDDPISGVTVKLAGEVEPDPDTGQLFAFFEENPQLPVSHFDFDFLGGPRATLTTPPTCGTYTTETALVPWSSPEGATKFPASAAQITTAPGGGPCRSSEAQLPNAPSFEAGSTAPLAGAYAPFVVKLSRENGSQRLAALNTTLPSGVTAKFAGVAECSEAQIAQAQSRSGLGEGALEKASPSCPQASQIGVVNVGAGSGNPFYVQGNVYLSGPYKGAPFSLAIITPAVAGPFDLGTVVVRAALYVDPETAQGTVKSDPLPTILKGIPLDVRSVAVKIDRSAYVLNPTSCEQKSVSAEAITTTGQVAHLSNRFQVGGCKGLDYTPKLSLSLKGATRRDGHPALKAVLSQPSGQANSRRIVLILPPTEFIDPLRTANPCTRPAFAEGRCPAASLLGKARVFTPLLDNPLEGPIYFRANGGARELPDAVADLNGRVHIVSVGFVDAVHRKGSESSRIRTTLATVPDAPISKAIIELRGGKKGLLVNSANLCKVPNTYTVKMVAQNGKTENLQKPLATSCKKK
jgi:hypothetical protein